MHERNCKFLQCSLQVTNVKDLTVYTDFPSFQMPVMAKKYFSIVTLLHVSEIFVGNVYNGTKQYLPEK